MGYDTTEDTTNTREQCSKAKIKIAVTCAT